MNTINLVFVDVEAADGPSPASGRMTQFGAVHYDTRESFYGLLFDSAPDPLNPAKSIITGSGGNYSHFAVMNDFTKWLAEHATHPVFVSDNPAYDFMWIACAFDELGMANPFGHSARRIGDFFAGISGDWRNTQRWKALRETKHDHQPVHDAMGNAEAFTKILAMADGLAEQRARGGVGVR